ncbi:MAG: hypothetical protein RL398_2009 [Planctomycetota bacterium]
MSVPSRNPAPQEAEQRRILKERMSAFVDALLDRDEERYEEEFVHLLGRVRELVERKLRMEGTKSDTRDFLGELLFTRLRRGMHGFLRGKDEVGAARAAEFAMGLLFSVSTLTEFARAFDQALLRSNSASKDFNFAGRTDFISVEEVLQMLGSGKHLGCLSLEKADNRLDVFLRDGRIWFLDPHHPSRRVLPGDSMRHREIPESALTQAQAARTQGGGPVLLTIAQAGHIKSAELREMLRMFGKEALFEFMRDPEPYAFYYRKLDELPEFAIANDLKLGVTSILLEGSKQCDDWKQMLAAFPDPDAALEPKADMFARMSDVPLSVVELKLLSQINGDTSPRHLVAALGLPLFEIYQLLIKLAHDGILAAPGGMSALLDGHLSVEESMQEAFAALDANDDEGRRRSAVDKALGEDVAAASVLERVLGSSLGALDALDAAPPAADGELDKELLQILRKPKGG